MSTTAIPKPLSAAMVERARGERLQRYGLIAALSVLALGVHGYHPYAEDGGLYAAGIKHLLHPGLYPHSAAFVEAHLRYSLFAPIVAGLTRLTGNNLPATLLLVHLGTIAATLLATWHLAGRCFFTVAARAGATMLMAAWLTLPIAGTSLLLMDPYLTARAIALPCALLALRGVLDHALCYTARQRRHGLFCALAALSVAAAMHPLMAGYALGDALLLRCLLLTGRLRRFGSVALLCGTAFVCASVLQARAPADSPDYTQIALTRYYWFLSQWHWYEWTGLAAPLALVAWLGMGSAPPAGTRARRVLASMAIVSGFTAGAIALAFVQASSSTHLVARLQPLRAFQMVYAVMIVLLGAVLGERVLGPRLRGSRLRGPRLWRWPAAFVLLAAGLFAAERATYPASAHIEWPGARPENPWLQAFAWIGRNTPTDALFALDTDYISAPGEDAQSFRAFSERSSLPDYSKDGGEASITPALTAAWTVGQGAQTALGSLSDAARLARLRPLNVTWLVLQRDAKTAFDCPYRNPAVQVCRLP